MKIDLNYTNSSFGKSFKGISFLIEKNPIIYSSEEVPPLKTSLFKVFSDEFIIINKPSTKETKIKVAIAIMIGATILFLASNTISYFLDEKGSLEENLLIFFACFSIFCYGIYSYRRAQQLIDILEFTFNRLEGTIQMPKSAKGDYFKIRFEDLKAKYTNIIMKNYNSGPILIFMTDVSMHPSLKDEPYQTMSWSNDPKEDWSFYVWYMDRNRPLPPGSAFDPYRKKDYERRKAEGFPPPLYESKIPIPEYVPEEEAKG